jgi:hypothetical protein
MVDAIILIAPLAAKPKNSAQGMSSPLVVTNALAMAKMAGLPAAVSNAQETARSWSSSFSG